MLSSTSSDSDSSLLVHCTIIMPSSKIAYVEHDLLMKVPILHLGNITPTVMREWGMACLDYFDAKEIPTE
jgi:hypothetical protein